MNLPEPPLPTPPVTPARRPRRRTLSVVVVLVVVAALVATVLVARHHQAVRADGLAAQAVVTASTTARGYTARDVVSSGSAERPGGSWRSNRQTIGAWVQLRWDEPQLMNRFVLVRNPLTESGATAGFLSFGDGTLLQVRLSPDSRVTTVFFTPRTTDRVRFVVTEVSPGARSVTIGELLVASSTAPKESVGPPGPGGDAAALASVDVGPGAGPGADLVDGSGSPGQQGVGEAWTAPVGPGAWAELRWTRPQEIDAVELLGAGSTRSADVRSATVTFSDGSTLPVGAVLADPARPTLVAFMPRVVTSLRIDLVGGSTSPNLALSELRAYTKGHTPVRAAATGRPPAGVGLPDPARCADDVGPQDHLVLVCPLSGSTVGDRTRVTAALGPDENAVTATVLASGGAAAAPPVTASRGPDGRAVLDVDTSRVPPGPLTLELVADGGDRSRGTVRAQLVRTGPVGPDVSSSAAAGARTLAYAEEFSTPVSLSRTGLGADYAAGKPVFNGAQDFGDAVFPDPATGAGNVGVVDGGYLHLGVEPLPAGTSDPQGYGRTHLGGLVASAREGGSGFSAQYGYFEARMFVPASDGTWPAFWLLPSDNLVQPTPVVAEIDAVELYGHDPRGACHSTHEYVDGKDGGVARCGRRFDEVDQAVGWHTYGVSVQPEENIFYVDGREVARAPQVRGGGSPMFFLADLALGGGWPVDLGSTRDRTDLFVDYVRVYV